MTISTHVHSLSNPLTFLSSLKIEHKKSEEIVNIVVSKLLDPGSIKGEVLFAGKTITITPDNVPQFLKTIIAKATRTSKNLEDLKKLLTNTISLEPVLGEKTCVTLIEKELKKLDKLLETLIDTKNHTLKKPHLKETTREEALSAPLLMGMEILELMQNVREKMGGDEAAEKAVFTFSTNILNRLSSFLESAESSELTKTLSSLVNTTKKTK